MDDPVRVQVVQGLDQLLSNLTHLWFTQVAVVFQDLEKLTLGELCHHAELMRSLERIEQQDDVLVVEAFENLNFLPQVVHFLFSLAPLNKIKRGH